MTTFSKILIAIALLCAAPLRAALSGETGQCTANTGSSTTTCTVGFQGKALILWTTGQTANGNDTANNASLSFGFSDGTNHRMIDCHADDNAATTNAERMWRTDRVGEVYSSGAPVPDDHITGVSFGATSVTLTWNATPSLAYLLNYILIGGSDVTDVLVGTQTLTTSTGAQSVTGLSFQPSFGVFINAQLTSAAGATAHALCSIGFAKDSTHEFTAAWGAQDAQTMTANVNAVSYTNQAASMSGITSGAETVDFLADFTGFNSDGYTVNVSNAPTAAWQVGYLLIKGGQWDVGTSTTPISSGTRSPTTAFQPQGVFLLHTSATADATVTIDWNTTAGAATSTSSEASGSASQDDAVINTTANRTSSNSKILASGSFPATSVDYTSVGATSFTVTEAGVSSTAYQMGWFVMADNAVAPTCAGTRALMGVGC